MQEKISDLQEKVCNTNSEDRIHHPAFIDISTSTVLKDIYDRKIEAKNLESKISDCMKHDKQSSYEILSTIRQFELNKMINHWRYPY